MDLELVFPENYKRSDEWNRSYWLIVFSPKGRDIIRLAESSDSLSYEDDMFNIASRKKFYDKQMAHEYAIELAEKHNITYDNDKDMPVFLD